MRRSTSDAEEVPREGRVSHIGASIRAFVEACGYTEKLQEQRAVDTWAIVVGEHLGPAAAHAAEAETVERGELRVRVPKAAWRQRLTYEIPVLIRQLNERLGADVIRGIRLR